MAKDLKTAQANEQKEKKQQKRDAAKRAADKKSRQHKLIFIGIIVVLVAFAALIIFNSIKNSGYTERHTVVASTENFEFTQSMMTFYFNSLYNQYANLYSSNTDNLNQFIQSVNERGSSYDLLLSSARSNVERYLTVAELAKEAGVELEKADLAEIDDTIKEYRDLKVKYGETNNAYQIMSFDKFLESMFGESVDESVVRDCLKLTQLVSKYQEEYLEEAEYTDEELEAYYDENKDSYTYVDVLRYQFTEPKPEENADTDTDTDTDTETAEAVDTAEETPDEDTGDEAADGEQNEEQNEEQNGEQNEEADADTAEDTEEEAPAEVSATRALADALASTKTVDEFNKFMTDYLTKEAEAALEEGKELDTEKIKSDVEALAKTKQLKGNITGDEAKEWAFSADTKVGDTKLIVDETAGTYTVYMMTKTAYRDEEATKNAALIYLTDANNNGDSKAKADEIKAEYEAGEKTVDAFLALAEKYSESGHNHVEEGYTRDTSVIGEWLYEDGRAEGDVEAIKPESGTATYVVYFAGTGNEGWKVSVKSAKSSDDFEAKIKEYAAAHAVNDDEENPTAVTYNEDAIKKVTPIALSPRS